jgi:hypothetical protein
LNPLFRGYKMLLFVIVMNGRGAVAEVGYRFEPRRAGASKVTHGTGFIRVFLTEVVLARRLARELRGTGDRPGASGPAAYTAGRVSERPGQRL